jgi:hypothetical protein
VNEAHDTNSRTPTAFNNYNAGWGLAAGAQQWFESDIAEFWLARGDILGDGAMNKRLLFDLAYTGPLSIPAVMKNVLLYGSLRHSRAPVGRGVSGAEYVQSVTTARHSMITTGGGGESAKPATHPLLSTLRPDLRQNKRLVFG